MVNEIKVSCIILSNLNDKFVKRRTIPSIIANSQFESIEIIVVDNSPEQDFERDYPVGLNNVKIHTSEPFHIAKGYNKGVQEASGKYIAIFHDDCEVRDEDWIVKFTRVLNDKVYAVSPQLHHQKTTTKNEFTQVDSIVQPRGAYFQEYLKECPLVMERDKFLEVGGYDETYYFGYEDIRFTDSINNLDKHIMQVDIGFKHYNGMSTVLLAHLNDKEKLEEYKNLFCDIEDKSEFRNIFNSDKVKQFFKKLVGFEWPSCETGSDKSWQDCEKDMPKTKEELYKFIGEL